MHNIKNMCKLYKYMFLWENLNDSEKCCLRGLKVTFNNPWIFVHR